MTEHVKKTARTAGLVPGTLVHVGEEKCAKVRITVIDYDENNFKEKEVKTIEECFPFKDRPTVTWINIDGVHEIDIIEKIGKHFNLHPLMQEDIADTGQRPKYEDLDKYLFVVLKMLDTQGKSNEIVSEQISLVLGAGFVISFQETSGDIFDNIRDRIRKSKGRVRKEGADYLAYSLVDAIVDNYFVMLETLGEKVEDIEDRLVSDPTPKTLQAIHDLKRKLIVLRKSIWPLREVVNSLTKGGSPLIQHTTVVYLRDVYDHTIRVLDTIETFRDMVSSMLDIYLSSISNRMNEVMKVLTIIATIFIPLTFISGVYGMNFRFMPELEWKYGYFLVLGLMSTVALFMVAYFKRKKWF